MIYHLSCVSCDVCGGMPAQPGDDYKDARKLAEKEGYKRVVQMDGGKADVCRSCQLAMKRVQR